MTKPDDIPQDVWDYARQLHLDEGILTCGKPNVTRLLARAIMAEREACAELIEDISVIGAVVIRNRGEAITPQAIRDRGNAS